MIAKTVRVREFKSITDSGDVRLDASVTCLVGKNESGKTAFLEPLYRLRPLATGHPSGFAPLRDFPRARWALERSTVPDRLPIEVTFELDDHEVDALEKEFGHGFLTSREVTIGRKYDNGLVVKLEWEERPAIRKLIGDADLDRTFSDGCSTVAELKKKLSDLDNASEAVQALVSELEGLDLSANLRARIFELVPRFLYFDEYSVLPGRVSIPRLQQIAEADLESGERTALALLKLAGVETQDFGEEDYEARKAALEAASNAITAEVFNFWSQNANLQVELDLDFKSPSAGLGQDPPFLDIRIRNLRHQITLNFGERSRGFVWFFSFLAAFSEYRDADGPLILLLDEPGLGLHGAAQADLLRYIEERLAPDHQVVYTTHSPFMVDPAKLDRVRLVEDVDGQGTKVSEDVLGTTRDTVFPLQAALGYEMAQTLFVGADNLIVEGPADYIYLSVLSGHLKANGRTGLDERWTIVPVGGLDKIPTFVALLGAQLNVAVVMDAAAGGSQKINDLVARGVIDGRKIVRLNAITGGKEADIEDLFDEDFYLQLLRKSGAGAVAKSKLPKGNRIVKRIELAAGKPFDHYRPARYLLEKQVDLLPKLSDAAFARFEQLFAELNDMLV